MHHIAEGCRNQMEISSLDCNIGAENVVRFIDAFVCKLDLQKLDFAVSTIKDEGRPSYHSSIFLKIYLYGYLNGIRSSRKLERECTRNIEMQWLCGKLIPSYHSIADFRKDNPKALRNTFKLFVSFLKDIDLIGGELIAIDGTKIRAHNSKKNNYSQKKIERHFTFIENKISEYMAQLDKCDAAEDEIKITNITKKIEQLAARKIFYETLETELKESGDTQISTTDADARALLIQGQVVEVSYNTQAAVDEKHKLVVATHTINRNDRNALTDIATEAKQNMEVETYTAIVDKGYHNGRHIQQTTNAGIVTIVAPPEIVNSNEHGTTPDYVVTKFVYDESTDTYTCPQGATLTTTGTWHRKSRERDTYQFKKYRTPKCKTCPAKHLCTGRAKGGREIERSEFAAEVEANNARYNSHKETYRKRQEINEHIFGTIKRVWGYYYTNLKGLEKVNGEWSLIMTVYNIKRTINILGIQPLLEKLKNWNPDYTRISRLKSKTTALHQFLRIQFHEHSVAA